MSHWCGVEEPEGADPGRGGVPPEGGSFHWRLAGLLKFLVEVVFHLLALCGPNEVTIKELFQNDDSPLCFPRFHIKYKARLLALHRMRAEVSDIADSVDGLANIRG